MAKDTDELTRVGELPEWAVYQARVRRAYLQMLAEQREWGPGLADAVDLQRAVSESLE